MRWALIYLDTTIPFPSFSDEKSSFACREITLSERTPGCWPYAGIDVSSRPGTAELHEAHRVLADFFTLVAWSTNNTARFVEFSCGDTARPIGFPIRLPWTGPPL